MVTDISGAWTSKKGKLLYIIVQVDDRFTWQVIHRNGITETGIGFFSSINPQSDGSYTVNAMWNFNGGDPDSKKKFKRDSGVVNKAATEVSWASGDDFERVI